MPDVPLQEDPKATVFEHIEVQRRGSITIITIARPAARNALHVPAHFELARAIDDFAADDQAWVAIITGSGDRAFCAGQDLTQPLPVDASDLPPSGFGGMTTRFDLTKPVIAARSEGHTSELQSLMRISYAVFCLQKKTNDTHRSYINNFSTT